METWLCSGIHKTLQYTHWILAEDADFDPNYGELLDFLPKDQIAKYPVFVDETNFTLSCDMMPFVDKRIRLIFHKHYVDDLVSGARSIRPLDIFTKQTTYIDQNITYFMIKNQNNYQLRMVQHFDSHLEKIPTKY
jgi:hypothetical protein